MWPQSHKHVRRPTVREWTEPSVKLCSAQCIFHYFHQLSCRCIHECFHRYTRTIVLNMSEILIFYTLCACVFLVCLIYPGSDLFSEKSAASQDRSQSCKKSYLTTWFRAGLRPEVKVGQELVTVRTWVWVRLYTFNGSQHIVLTTITAQTCMCLFLPEVCARRVCFQNQ